MFCNLIRHGKTDSGNVLCQLVRILLQHRVHLLPIGLPDFKRLPPADSVLLQIDHGIPNVLFFAKLRSNFTRNPFADPLHLRQPLRLLVQNAHGLFAEFLHNSGSQRLSDAFDGTGGKIPVNRLCAFRLYHLVLRHLQLFSIYRMGHHFTGDLHTLPFRYGRREAGTGNLLPLLTHLKYGIEILLIAINNC